MLVFIVQSQSVLSFSNLIVYINPSSQSMVWSTNRYEVELGDANLFVGGEILATIR